MSRAAACRLRLKRKTAGPPARRSLPLTRLQASDFYSVGLRLGAWPVPFAEQADVHAVGPENGDFGIGVDDALAVAAGMRIASDNVTLAASDGRSLRCGASDARTQLRIVDNVLALDDARRIVDQRLCLADDRPIAHDFVVLTTVGAFDVAALAQFLDQRAVGRLVCAIAAGAGALGPRLHRRSCGG